MLYAMNQRDYQDRLMICRDAREMERLRPVFPGFDMITVDEPLTDTRYRTVVFTHHPEVDLGDLMSSLWESGLAGESRIFILG